MDRQLLNNLQALQAGDPLPQYGPIPRSRPISTTPTPIDGTSIIHELRTMTQYQILALIAGLALIFFIVVQLEADSRYYFVFLVMNMYVFVFIIYLRSVPDREQVAVTNRDTLYPRPQYLSPEQINIFSRSTELRQFNYRLFETAIHLSDRFMKYFSDVGRERETEDPSGLAIREMIEHRRLALDAIYRLQYSMDDQYVAALARVREMIKELDETFISTLRIAITTTNAVRREHQYPPINLDLLSTPHGADVETPTEKQSFY